MPAIAYRGQLNLCHCFKTLKKAAFRNEETTARERCLPGAPSTFEAEQAKGADVFIHEVMVTPEEFAEKNYVPVEHARLIMNEHTMPDELGAVFSIAKPRLGVGMHFSVGDSLIDPLFERWRTTYDGPLLLIQDLTTINVTPEQIVIRQTKADLLAWPPPPEGKDEKSEIVGPSKAQRPELVVVDWCYLPH